ncbi:MAG: hypothetical protein ACI9DK_003134 [Vicingaceae bacterium]|jgi:hypothetical protein
MQRNLTYFALTIVNKLIHIVLCVFLLSCSHMASSQCPETNPDCHVADNWMFGDSILATFDKDTFSVQVIDFDKSYEAISTVSDQNGKLLAYCNPESFYSVTCDSVYSLPGHLSSFQGSLLIRDRDSEKIHIFANGAWPQKAMTSNHLIFDPTTCSLISAQLLLDSATEQLGSVNHQNNRDFWIGLHSINSADFYFFVVKPNANTICPVIQAKGINYSRFNSPGTSLTFSHSGKYYLESIGSGESLLYSFNSQNGHLGSKTFRTNYNSWAAAFSSNDSFLYLAETDQVIQYKIHDSFDFRMSLTEYLLTPKRLTGSIYDIQLSTNQKIYFAYLDKAIVPVIHYPDSIKYKAHFVEKGASFGRTCYGSLPNFNQSVFYTPTIDFAYTENCSTNNYEFEGRDTFNAINFKWIFENESQRDSSDTKICSYQFPDSGNWIVSHIAWNSKFRDTVAKTISIQPKLTQNILGNDTFYCTGDTVDIVLNVSQNMHCVHWMGEEANLDDSKGKIIEYDHFHADSFLIDTAGIYTVRITNKSFCQAWDTIRVVEGTIPNKPTISEKYKELVSAIKANKYRWYLNDSFIEETNNATITPEDNGYFQVELVSKYGCISEKSDSFLVTFVGVENIEPLKFNIYPNPSSGALKIDFEVIGNYQIHVFTLEGKLILESEVAKQTTTTFELSKSGRYLLKLTSDDGQIGSQIILIEK